MGLFKKIKAEAKRVTKRVEKEVDRQVKKVEKIDDKIDDKIDEVQMKFDLGFMSGYDVEGLKAQIKKESLDTLEIYLQKVRLISVKWFNREAKKSPSIIDDMLNGIVKKVDEGLFKVISKIGE